MRKQINLFFICTMLVFSACSSKNSGNFILVEGGAFLNKKSNFYSKDVTVPDFYIGKYEVTQEEWITVMGNNPSEFKGNNLPVENVNWYECIEYCNKRSIKEGLEPYYTIDKYNKDPHIVNETDNMKWTVTINKNSSGYRLPTEAEWEYASGGGIKSKSYSYSGSNDIDEVAWYWVNSGDKKLSGYWSWSSIQKNNCKTKPIGSKKSNELGIYDMSGNVREWCWDIHESLGPEDFQGRIWKGGGWIGADFSCESSFQASFAASGKGPDQGLRLCRSVQTLNKK